MCRSFSLKGLVLLFILALGVAPRAALADITFSTPDVSNPTVAYCDEYFQNEWGTRLSMDNAATGAVDDINLQTNQVDALSYSNGILSFNTTGTSSYLTLLQYTVVGSLPVGSRYGENKPIDSSTYRLLSFRMYSSSDTVGRIRWFHDYSRWALTTFTVYAGWHTYQIDLAAATIATSQGSNVNYQDDDPQGLELFPTNHSGVAIQLDWVQLTKASSGCSTYTLNYNATASNSNNLFSLIADTNADYTDGIVSTIYTGTVAGAASQDLNTSSLFPTTYHIYGIQSGDWASLNQRDPWDMSSSTDIKTSTLYHIAGTSFSSGLFSGTTTGTDPSFYLNIETGNTLDATVYKFVSVGLNLTFPSGSSGLLQLLLFDSSGNFAVKNTTTSAGSQVYQIDLSSFDGTFGAFDPTHVANIRIDFSDFSSGGEQFALDFIAFRQAGYVASLSAPSISEAPGTLTVNDFVLNMVQPDKAGGRDFAQTVLGNSWNMNTGDDMSLSFNLLSAQIYPHNILMDETSTSRTGDFYRSVNIPGNGDGNQALIFYDANLNSAQFVNFCFRGWNQTEVPSGFNSVSRIIWQDPRNESYKTGDDIVMNKGAQTYCVDMTREIQLEPALPDGSPNPWTTIGDASATIQLLRLDMNENEEGASAAYDSVIDYVTVRTDHESNTQYAIVVDADLNTPVTLYSNTSRATSGGTMIGSLMAGRNTNVYKWDTTGVSENKYYIYATATLNGNTVSRLAEGRVNVNHSLTQDTTAPILECERPFAGYEFDTSLELAGYALDETRLATVEVFIDGDFFTAVQPSMFHLGARDAYASYAESNQPGFQQFENATSISYGAHTLSYIATDTAGNETTCSRSITRTNGASTPAALTYPTPDASTVDLPVNQDDTPDITPDLSISVTGKKDVTVTVTGTELCETFTLQAAKKDDFAGATNLYTGAGTESITFTAQNVPKFKVPAVKAKKVKGKAKAAKEDGKIAMRVVCNGGQSDSATLNVKSAIKKTKGASKNEAQLIVYLNKKI